MQTHASLGRFGSGKEDCFCVNPVNNAQFQSKGIKTNAKRERQRERKRETEPQRNRDTERERSIRCLCVCPNRLVFVLAGVSLRLLKVSPQMDPMILCCSISSISVAVCPWLSPSFLFPHSQFNFDFLLHFLSCFGQASN